MGLLDNWAGTTEPQLITDNTTAQRLLVELGMLEALSKPAPAATEWVNFCAYNDHHAWWVFGQNFTQFVKDADNGFAIHLYPKSVFTQGMAMALFKGDMAAFFDSDTEFTRRLTTVSAKRP